MYILFYSFRCFTHMLPLYIAHKNTYTRSCTCNRAQPHTRSHTNAATHTLYIYIYILNISVNVGNSPVCYILNIIYTKYYIYIYIYIYIIMNIYTHLNTHKLKDYSPILTSLHFFLLCDNFTDSMYHILDKRWITLR